MNERHAVSDRRPRQKRRKRPGAGQDRRRARAEVHDQLALLVERRAGEVVDHPLERRGHRAG
jgi:hypothetical protein